MPLPDKYEIDEYRMIEEFSLSVENRSMSDELLRNIRGSGAFRRFRQCVERFGLLDQWYACKQRAYEQLVKDWCEANEIPYARD